MVYVKRKDTFHIDSTDLYGEYNSFDAHDELFVLNACMNAHIYTVMRIRKDTLLSYMVLCIRTHTHLYVYKNIYFLAIVIS